MFRRSLFSILFLLPVSCSQPEVIDGSIYGANDYDLAFAPEIEEVFSRNIQRITQMAHSDKIVETLHRANRTSSTIKLSEIEKRDQQWRKELHSPENAPLIQSILTTECTKTVQEFQSNNAGFSEIFITDQYGLNVCQTDLTSDYYQKDEQWWLDTYADGKGDAHRGNFEYDESSQARAIPIYIPIKDTASHQVIGIAKAVLEIDQIKSEL